MPTSGVPGHDNLLKIHAQLLFGLRDDPHVGLKSVVNRVRIRIGGRKSVVHRKYGHIYFIRPLPRVALMSTRVLTNKAAAVEVDDRFFNWLLWLRNCFSVPVNVFELLWTQESDFHLSGIVKFALVRMVLVVSRVLTQVYLFRGLHELFNSFVSQIVVELAFLQCEGLRKHGDK